MDTDLQQNNHFKNFFFQVVDDNAKIVSEWYLSF